MLRVKIRAWQLWYFGAEDKANNKEILISNILADIQYWLNVVIKHLWQRYVMEVG